MRFLTVLQLRLRSVFYRRKLDDDLNEELRYHLDRQIQEEVQRGVSPEEAHYVAVRSLRDIEQRKEECRDMRRMNIIDNTVQNFRYAIRGLLTKPAFAFIAVLTLALGIGPNTAIFSIVYATLLAPLPYVHSEQLVMIWSNVKGHRNQVAAADFLDWKRDASSFQQMAAFVERPYNLSSTQEPQYINGLNVSTNWHRLLGERVLMGRDFGADEDQLGKDHVFILSHRCWMNRFGADPNIIGKQFRLNGEPYTAIGVMPAGASDRHDEEIWLPVRFTRAELSRGNTFWYVIARLNPGVSLTHAREEMNAITRRIAEQYPATNSGLSATVEPLKNDFQSPETIRNLWLLLAAVSFVLLIACANVANLLLVRGVARRREVAIRAALGASRSRLVFQMIVESLTLAAFGGALGLLLAVSLLKVILAILPPGTLSSEADVRISGPVLLFTLLTATLSGILFGCAPAMGANVLKIREALNQDGRSTPSRRPIHLQETLVVVEYALALTLLAGAALTVHSFINRTHVDLGIRTDHVLTFYLPVPHSKLAREEQTAAFYRELLARIESVPGVRRAAASTNSPLDDANVEMPVSIIGSRTVTTPDINIESLTPSYFETFGVHLERGRIFNEGDGASGPAVAMVNEAFVRRFLSGLDPLTTRLMVGKLQNGELQPGPFVVRRIVGVFRDIQNSARPGQPKLPQIWVPFAQSPWPHSVVSVRTAMDASKCVRDIARAVHSLDPNLPLADVKTIEQRVRDQFVEDRFGMALYGSLAGIALLLACAGTYGVMSFAVARSTPDIGLRIALGATAKHVVSNVIKRGLKIALAGMMLGILGAYAASRALRSSLYGTGTVDWSAVSIVVALLLITALLACYIPARRASSVDPMVALRQS
jgi:putative ABC transport system permease protein